MRWICICISLAIGPIAALACTGGKPAPPKTGTASSASDAGGEVAVASASSAAPLPSGAVSAVVFSDDECKVDTDCVPERTCHPDRCRTAANAGEMLPGTLCTNTCAASAVECGQNHCGCAFKGLAKRCAVLPGP